MIFVLLCLVAAHFFPLSPFVIGNEIDTVRKCHTTKARWFWNRLHFTPFNIRLRSVNFCLVNNTPPLHADCILSKLHKSVCNTRSHKKTTWNWNCLMPDYTWRFRNISSSKINCAKDCIERDIIKNKYDWLRLEIVVWGRYSVQCVCFIKKFTLFHLFVEEIRVNISV